MQNGYPYGENNPKRVDLDKIDSFTPDMYGLTPSAIKGYMVGMEIKDPETGESLPDSWYWDIIESAIKKAEDVLDIVILPRPIAREHHDYYDSEYNSYAFTTLYKKPILQVLKFKLQMNNFNVFNYPPEWWKIYPLAGQIQIFPSPLMQATGMGGSGSSMSLGFMSAPVVVANSFAFNGASGNYAPQAFDIDYVAGFLPPKRYAVTQDFEFPAELRQLVIKYAMKEALQQWGRLIIGAGIAGRSFSIDGISESIETTQSAMYTGSRADIDIIDQDISDLLDALRAKFQPQFTEL